MEIVKIAKSYVKEKFVVDSDVKADWAIAKIIEHQNNILEHEKRRDELIAEYKKRIAITRDICDDDCKEDFAAIDSLTEQLREYAASKMPANKRTLKFGFGNISFRKQPTKFYFADDNSEPNVQSQKLLDFARKVDQNLILTHYTVDWDRFKRRLKVDTENGNEIVDTVTGEVITDIYAVTPPEKFIVTPREI